MSALLSLQAQRHPLAPAHVQRATLSALPLARTFEDAVGAAPMGTLRATGVQVLQINVGKVCNQACHHCHVDAGPDRREQMPDNVVEACLRVLDTAGIPTLDITGGAPELHPRFEHMVSRAAALGRHVMDRCNLTILTVPRFRALPRFLADHRVEVVSSLPSPGAERTDAQRGDGVFEKSLEGLRALNAVGYGMPGTGLTLTLVTNPTGAFLPGGQSGLEAEFRRVLRMRHGVEFTRLFAITNMPISRFLEWLERTGNTQRYMEKLVAAFNPAAAEGVMCRTTLSVALDGTLYDCDFNQMLEMPLVEGQPRTIHAFEKALLDTRAIAVGPHCFGCTAGQGSSCGGATAG
jgi:radical SAM/Cys-rich protein